jgi:hypothetical protein
MYLNLGGLASLWLDETSMFLLKSDWPLLGQQCRLNNLNVCCSGGVF